MTNHEDRTMEEKLRELEDYRDHVITLFQQGTSDPYSLFADKEIMIKLLEMQILIEKKMIGYNTKKEKE